MSKAETEVVLKYVLTQDQINQIAAIAGKEAVKTFKEEQAKAEKKRKKEEDKVKKTKKMLSSYRRMKATLTDEVEFTEEEKIELRWKFIEDLMGNAKSVVDKSERTINDNEKRRQENLYCINRIEKATGLYREECEKSGNDEAKRRYRELEMLYLTDEVYTVQQIAEIENISEKTVYKDIGMACGIIAVYLLGM